MTVASKRSLGDADRDAHRGPYGFFFCSNERGEPAHIHVRRDGTLAKFWLGPIGLAKSRHFSAHELNVIRQHIEDNLQSMLEAWNEHLGR